MRLVLDTDVLVAGLRSHTGASRILLQAIEAGAIQPLVSVATVLEYEAVLTRDEQLDAMHAGREYVERFLDRVMEKAIEVSPILQPRWHDPRPER
jgi:predicted nucleic acid-binding protein